MEQEVNVCPKFWKDVKKSSCPEFNYDLAKAEFTELDDLSKIEAIPILQSIVTLIQNAIKDNELEHHSIKYGKQPFLQSGWIIRKMRWAIGNKGKSDGLRVLFCLNENKILMVLIALKRDCAKEEDLEKEIMARIKDYICV
ncbi:hypothetical protein CO019_01865 [Candidatus Berkelbacteria bacterium CG_4_9_14_0_2_um_filter_42_30]|uniref:Addiction module toxin RelE n=3 Tax=Candidatus Berkelbacteria TaxID=1618330 RepID=A0A2M7K175_9BACT|nr:MAG: hypothetical protein COV40_00020 [Candidatus Berkelbacteria bacterium CG11_big_fil_rev_8_21_14_0_20_42_15]PIX30017.1 MAG: hypothetical protein COZ63_01950 [Candidatus Berkelbacteria bacterium CG_4_8_14_3_um_filter_42_13]PJC65592.1 MAG: hypothetical protein CO019_01865 [Candidatus Berkelbacteria bacterium CG_4_9_14_0_2_um_filter_42_30]